MSSSPTETAGRTPIVMPQMGVSVAEGTIVEWLKQPGDWIEADETVCVVTTDKIDVEIPAPASGRLAEIVAPEGETVEVGAALAEIDTAASPGQAHPEEQQAGERPAPPGAEQEAEPAEEPDRSRFHSPVVQRIAAKHGVDLDRIEGTGIGGRVRKRDVLAFVEGGAGPVDGNGEASAPLHIESPYKEETEDDRDGGGDEALAERRETMSPMRSAIARHMVESRRTAAHCTTVVEADMSAVARVRAELKQRYAEREVPLTYLAFVAQAAVAELARFPILNASVEADELVLHSDVNLGIAVALDEGLIVPVIRRAQRLSLEGIAAAIAEAASRAREGKLAPDDVHGGTFTITNPGQFGAVLATPIINQPQVAILDLEAIVKRPVVVETPEGDGIGIRPMTNLCMSWDHRALDGADASRFLGAVKSRLESWEADR